MCPYVYVPKRVYKPTKKDIILLIHKVQRFLRKTFRFEFRFVGSTKRNMITKNTKSNVGYDFDLDIRIHLKRIEYTPCELKHILMDAFNNFVHQFNYDYCEDNGRVFTIKMKDTTNAKIIHSCDFAIVRDTEDGRIEFIRHQRQHNTYFWELQNIYPSELIRNITFIKRKNKWNEVRNLYLWKKNSNENPNKKSRSIYSETINEIYLKYHK